MHGNFFTRAAHPNPRNAVWRLFPAACIRNVCRTLPLQSHFATIAVERERTIAAALLSGADRDRGLGRGIVRCVHCLSVVSRDSAAAANLADYPQALLKSSPTTAGWHSLGMEWKEHIAWFAVIAITMAASVLIQYGQSIRQHPQMRKAVHGFVVVALLSAMIAGYFGAMLNKHAPVRGGAIHQFMQESR